MTLGQIWLAFTHRVGAMAVTLLSVATVGIVIWRFSNRALLLPSVILAGLLLAQITLGVLTVVLRKPADVASAHVAVGALVLVLSFVILTRTIRLYGGRPVSFAVANRARSAQRHWESPVRPAAPFGI